MHSVFIFAEPRLTLDGKCQKARKWLITHYFQRLNSRRYVILCSWQKQLCNEFLTHPAALTPFVCVLGCVCARARYKSGRYAFVMSLSSHFSIQIQNNCVIMNVDTNQHTHTHHCHSLRVSHGSAQLSSPSASLIPNGCDSLIGRFCEMFNPENMNLCTHIQISSYYVPLITMDICVMRVRMCFA